MMPAAAYGWLAAFCVSEQCCSAVVHESGSRGHAVLAWCGRFIFFVLGLLLGVSNGYYVKNSPESW